MNQFFYYIISRASKLIHSDDYRKRNITNDSAFTRNQKLIFPVMISLILNFRTRTMQIEIDDFFQMFRTEKTIRPQSRLFLKPERKSSLKPFSSFFK